MDEEVRAEALNLSDEDERVARLTEPRLRHLLGLQEPVRQLRQFPPPGRHGAPRGLKEGHMTAPIPVLSVRLPEARVPNQDTPKNQ